MNYQSVKVAITPAPADPLQTVALMDFITVGRGDRLPNGAAWIDSNGDATHNPQTGWWMRPVEDELVFELVLRSFRGSGRPAPAGYRVLGNDEPIPEDRTYRNAWVNQDKSIVHDMAKAREIHKNFLREARAPELAALDAAYLKADEAGDTAAKADIAAQKQVLRDITKHPDIDAAASVDDLKRVTLGLLKAADAIAIDAAPVEAVIKKGG